MFYVTSDNSIICKKKTFIPTTDMYFVLNRDSYEKKV